MPDYFTAVYVKMRSRLKPLTVNKLGGRDRCFIPSRAKVSSVQLYVEEKKKLPLGILMPIGVQAHEL